MSATKEIIDVFLVPMSVQHGLHIIIYPLLIIYGLTMILLYFCYHRRLHQHRLPVGSQSPASGRHGVSRRGHGVGPNSKTRSSLNSSGSVASGSGMGARMDSPAQQHNDKTPAILYPVGFAQCSMFSTFLFALFTLDFWTDLLFTITLWYNGDKEYTLAFASTIFLAAPYISGLTTYFYALRRWRVASSPHVKYWLERYDWLLNALVLMSGEAYGPILLLSSFILYNDTFSLHLQRTDLYSIRMTRFFTRFFFANFPQFAIQCYYLMGANWSTNEVVVITMTTTILAIVCEIVAIVVGVQNIPCLSRPLESGVRFEIEMDVEVNQFHLHAAHDVMSYLLGNFLHVPSQDVEIFDVRRFKDVGFDSVGVIITGIVTCNLNSMPSIHAAIVEMGSEHLDEFKTEVLSHLCLPMSATVGWTAIKTTQPDGNKNAIVNGHQSNDVVQQPHPTAKNYRILCWNTWGIVFASPRTLTNPHRCAKFVEKKALEEDWKHYDGVVVMCFQEIWAFRVGYLCHIWLYLASYFEYLPWLGLIVTSVSVFCSLILGFVPFFNELYEPKHGVIRTLMDYLPFYYGPSGASFNWKKPLDSGLLILTNRPITDHGFEAYGDSTGDDQMANKGFMWVYCRSQNLLVVNTHLQHAGTGPQRKRQLGQIRNFLKDWRDRPGIDILVMGDFNIAMDDPNEAPTTIAVRPTVFESPQRSSLANAISNGGNGSGHFPIPTNSPGDDSGELKSDDEDRQYVGVHGNEDFADKIDLGATTGTDPVSILRLRKINDYHVTHLKKKKCIDHILVNFNPLEVLNTTMQKSLRLKMSDHALVVSHVTKEDDSREEHDPIEHGELLLASAKQVN